MGTIKDCLTAIMPLQVDLAKQWFISHLQMDDWLIVFSYPQAANHGMR